MKHISKPYLLPLNSDDNHPPPAPPAPAPAPPPPPSPCLGESLLILIWMESLSLHWRRSMTAEVFLGLRCRSAGLPLQPESDQINADSIDVDVGPYVENTIHKKYRLQTDKWVRGCFIDSSCWIHFNRPFIRGAMGARWRAEGGFWSFERWTRPLMRSYKAQDASLFKQSWSDIQQLKRFPPWGPFILPSIIPRWSWTNFRALHFEYFSVSSSVLGPTRAVGHCFSFFWSPLLPRDIWDVGYNLC